MATNLFEIPEWLDYANFDNYPSEENPTTNADFINYARNQNKLVGALTGALLWQPNTNFIAGKIIISPNMPEGMEAVALTGGVTGTAEPAWDIDTEEYQDSGVKWKLRWKHWSKSVEEIADLTTGATNRLPNTTYAVGNVVYDRSNLSVALKCTTAGTTSNTVLDISTRAVGDTVTDGSVVWEVVKRDLSEEVKANADNFANYLSLTGGTMTGGVVAKGEGTIPFITRGDAAGALNLYGGDTYDKSALISLKGIDNHYIDGEEGGFFISSTDGTTKHWLAGLKNGELFWKGSRIINGVSIQAQYIRTPNTPVYLPEGGTWVGIWVQSVGNNDYADSGIVYQAGGSWLKTTDANSSAFSLICFRVI
ncbi:MAG: hypothetical protein IKL58_00140 [Phascolarctobacterium sp.]|nr:hypothetical protein [Phascolarctobacterium sp.]